MSVYVKIEEVIKRDCFYVARQVARTLKEKTYFTAKDFFTSISQADLDVIIDKLFAIRVCQDAKSRHRRQADITLLGMLLHIGEGKSEFLFEEEEVQNAYMKFSKMAIVWQLHLEQPDEVKVNLSNFNFESDLPLYDKG